MNHLGVSVRFDEGSNEFVLGISIAGLGEFEATGQELSEALTSLGEQLAEAGV